MQMFKSIIKWIAITLASLLILLIISLLILKIVIRPSNDRNWNTDQKILSHASIKGNFVNISNIRNLKYASTTSYEVDYYDKTFDLDKLVRVWFVVEPFESIQGAAHTFLSFEFEDNQFVSISVEIRKEVGESYHPVKGILRQYELMYVIADERDVVKLRSNYRKDDVFVYPAKASKEKVQSLFIDMLNRANELAQKPDFYNTVTSNCTTNIARHINSVTPGRVPFFNIRFLLPATSDELAYNLGLIDTDLPFMEARKKFHINERAMKYADDPDFSIKIRQHDQ